MKDLIIHIYFTGHTQIRKGAFQYSVAVLRRDNKILPLAYLKRTPGNDPGWVNIEYENFLMEILKRLKETYNEIKIYFEFENYWDLSYSQHACERFAKQINHKDNYNNFFNKYNICFYDTPLNENDIELCKKLSEKAIHALIHYEKNGLVRLGKD